MTNTRSNTVAGREQIYRQLSATELGKRSAHGPALYPTVALFTVLGSSLKTEYPIISISMLTVLAILGAIRIWYSRGFEARYELIGERAITLFTVLLLMQAAVFSVSSAAIVLQYGLTPPSFMALLFCSAAAAAGTSSLSTRLTVHRLFLFTVMLPLTAALIPGFGSTGMEWS